MGVEGKLLPSHEEVMEKMKKEKKGTIPIYPRMHVVSGEVGFNKEKFEVAVGLDGSF